MRSLRGRLPYILAACLLLVVAAVSLGVWYLIRNWADLGGTTARIDPVVVVEATYPGANAQVVADTVAAPIEQQVDGVEGMRSLSSQCTSDGAYRLTVTFRRGTDLNMAQVLVQNRVSLALPVLPAVVQQQGIKVMKQAPHPLLFVMLSSPDGRFDDAYLSNYADLQIKDELARLPGVGAAVHLCARGGYGVRVHLDPEKLAPRNLTALDVVKALEKHGAVAPRLAGNAILLDRKPGGRLDELAQLGDLPLRTDAGADVPLRDVARIELGGANDDGQADFDGKPAAVVCVYPLPGARPWAVSTAVRETLALLREHLPEGLELAVPFDFTPNWEAVGRSSNPEYLLLDVELPASASAQRTQQVLKQCATVAERTAGVRHVLTLTENPFDHAAHQPCILVALDGERKQPGHDEIAAHLRKQLAEEVRDAVVRVRDLSGPGDFPHCGYPVDFAVRGPDPESVQKLATRLEERLRRSDRLTDVSVAPSSRPRPQLVLDIDRDKAKALGVALEDVNKTLQAAFGAVAGGDANGLGPTWQLRVQVGDRPANPADDLGKLEVRSNQGERVRLGVLVTSRLVEGPAAVHRLDMQPMIELTANPAAGASPAEVRALCVKLADEVRQDLGLPTDYGLTWLDASGSR
jgi:multidrug efflux pump subunit AcrB